MPRSRKSRAIPLLTLWGFMAVIGRAFTFNLLCLHLHVLSFLRFRPTKHVMHFLLPIHVTCSTHLTLLHMISQVVFGQVCKTPSSSLHSSHYPSRTFFLSDQRQQSILEHHSPILSHNAIGQVSLPYKTSGKIIPA